VLTQARNDVRKLPGTRHKLDESRVLWNLAIVGRPRSIREARDQKNQLAKVVLDYRKLLGSAHPDTVACELATAAAYRRAHESQAAMDMVKRCLRVYLDDIGLAPDHPFVGVCTVELGLSMRACGRTREALTATRAGWVKLQRALGMYHPWAVAAMVSHAADLVNDGNPAWAVEMLTAAQGICQNYLSTAEKHPYFQVISDNLALATQLVGQPTTHTHPAWPAEWVDIDIDIPQS